MTRPRPPANSDWDLAPCGLVEVDARRIITRANERFLRYTGYTESDMAAGLAWTALMTPAGQILFETQLAPMLALNGRVDEVMLDVVGRDGRRRPVLANFTARRADGPGPDQLHIALMSVPDRQQYELQLRDAQRRAEQAGAAHLQVRNRLELLANANSALASSLDVETALRGLARVLTGELADWCLVFAVDPDHPRELPFWSAAHIDPQQQAHVERLARLLPAHASPDSLLTRVLGGAGPLLLREVTAEQVRSNTTSDEVRALYAELDLASALVVPSRARAQQAAIIVLARGRDRPRFTEDDRAEISDLADRTGIAIDNLRLYAREHSTSVALQKALLTPLPVLDHVDLASRYVPGANGSEVGGDWYDAFRGPGDATVLVVGDVAGHDIEAAAAMGQLRGVIRTVGHTIAADAADLLVRADRAAAGLQVGVVASAIVAMLAPAADANEYTLRWSNAGHPPPLVLRHDGRSQVLARPPDVLLGVQPVRPRREFATDLAAGDCLLLYTDGLVERRDVDIEVSIAELAEHLAGVSTDDLEALCDTALRRRPPGNNDDVALLAVRIRGPADRPAETAMGRL